MSGEGVVSHELFGDLFRQGRVEPPLDVDIRQLLMLVGGIGGKFPAFPLDVSLFGIRLRTDGNVLAGSHRHRAGDEARDPGHQNLAAGDLRCRHPDHQARRRDDAIVRPQHGGPEPADPFGPCRSRCSALTFTTSPFERLKNASPSPEDVSAGTRERPVRAVKAVG